MKFTLTLLLVTISLLSYGQDKTPVKLGIGQVSANSLCCREIWRESFDSVFIDKELKHKVSGEKLWPFLYHPDYYLFAFICLDSGDNYYHILFDDSHEGYVYKSSFSFESWDSILINSTGIERYDSIYNPLRKTPDISSDTLSYPCTYNNKVKDNFTVIDTKQTGNTYWIKVAYPIDCEHRLYSKEQARKFPSGWIIWRKGEKLYLDIFMLC